MLRLKGPAAPAPDPTAPAREQYYREVVEPLAMQKIQLEVQIDDCNSVMEAAQARQDEARARLVEVAAQLKKVIAAAPK